MPTDNESLRDKIKRADVLDEFCELMFAHELHYDELLAQLEKWGVRSSLGALSRFKASHIGAWSMERAKNEEKAFLEKHGADLDQVTRNMIATRIFQAAANPNTSNKDVLKMKDLLIREAQMKLDVEKLQQDNAHKTKALEQKQQEIDQKERRIAALEAQAAEEARQRQEAAEAMQKASKNGGISEETVSAVRAALGMSPS